MRSEPDIDSEVWSVFDAALELRHIGHACRFRTRLFKSEREGLEVGEVVLVGGDSVEPRQARVIELTNDGREVELKFVAFSEL